MSNKLQLSKGATEIKELSQTLRRGGMLVVARCYSIPDDSGRRFELLLEAHGRRGVVDIAGDEQAHLSGMIAAAIEAFAAAALLREGSVVGGH